MRRSYYTVMRPHYSKVGGALHLLTLTITDAQTMSQVDQNTNDMLSGIFIEPADTQANVKRVICSDSLSLEAKPAVNK